MRHYHYAYGDGELIRITAKKDRPRKQNPAQQLGF